MFLEAVTVAFGGPAQYGNDELQTAVEYKSSYDERCACDGKNSSK